MKTLNPIVLSFCIVLCFSIISSCKSKSEKSNPSEEIVQEFNATLIGTYKYAGPDTLPKPKCTDSLNAWRAIVDAVGTEETLGDIQVHFDFCGDAESHYGNSYAYLVDKDSDTLFLDCSGQVIDGRLEEHPDFVTSYWKDKFYVTNGTGKFQGASGEIEADDYNSSKDDNSHHFWKGTIKIVK